MQEVWKDVQGYEGYYRVSNFGRLVSLRSRWGLRKKPMYIKGMRVKGYIKVKLLTEVLALHRLVASHFLPNPNNLPVINHKDKQRDNNHVDNIEWCTTAHNNEHANAKHYQLVSPDGVVVDIYNMSAFCTENNLAWGNISKVLRGVYTNHKGWSKP